MQRARETMSWRHPRFHLKQHMIYMPVSGCGVVMQQQCSRCKTTGLMAWSRSTCLDDSLCSVDDPLSARTHFADSVLGDNKRVVRW